MDSDHSFTCSISAPLVGIFFHLVATAENIHAFNLVLKLLPRNRRQYSTEERVYNETQNEIIITLTDLDSGLIEKRKVDHLEDGVNEIELKTYLNSNYDKQFIEDAKYYELSNICKFISGTSNFDRDKKYRMTGEALTRLLKYEELQEIREASRQANSNLYDLITLSLTIVQPLINSESKVEFTDSHYDKLNELIEDKRFNVLIPDTIITYELNKTDTSIYVE